MPCCPPRNADSESESTDSTHVKCFVKLREGELDDKEIDVELEQVSVGVEIMAPPGMEEMTSQLQNMFSNLGQGKKRNSVSIKEARKRLHAEEAAH